MISNIALIEAEGKRQGLHGRKLKGFVKSKLRKIIKKIIKDKERSEMKPPILYILGEQTIETDGYFARKEGKI